jgi:hypothetical protein
MVVGIHKGSGMNRESEYRGYAGDVLDLVKGAAYASDKFRLLVLADAWLKLALKIRAVPTGRRDDSDTTF